MPTKFVTPYHIQRIKKAVLKLSAKKHPHFVGFYKQEKAATTCPEHRSQLRATIPLDYMGSAEFEFGSVPNALQKMSKVSTELVTIKLELESKGLTHQVYLLVLPSMQEEAIAFITKAASGPYEVQCKELPGIHQALFQPASSFMGDVSAWLDIDNGWCLTSTVSQLNSIKLLLGIN